MGLLFPLTPLKWCGNKDIEVERVRRRVAVKAHSNRSAGANITKALQMMSEESEKEMERKHTSVGLFGNNFFSLAKSVKKRGSVSKAGSGEASSPQKQDGVKVRRLSTYLEGGSLAESNGESGKFRCKASFDGEGARNRRRSSFDGEAVRSRRKSTFADCGTIEEAEEESDEANMNKGI